MRVITFENQTPQVHATSWIAPHATLVGQVNLGPDSTVMFGAVLRGDRERISVGAGSNLQDNVVVHADPGFPTTIGANVSVGHAAVVHGATIEDTVLIGMGAIVLNGCHIGSGSIIAAGAVVLEGTTIPPDSLVAGIPGSVRRATTPQEREGIARNAETYQDLGRRYRNGSH